MLVALAVCVCGLSTALRCNIALYDRFIPSTILTATFAVISDWRRRVPPPLSLIPVSLQRPPSFPFFFFFCLLLPSTFWAIGDYVLWVLLLQVCRLLRLVFLLPVAYFVSFRFLVFFNHFIYLRNLYAENIRTAPHTQ